MKRDIYHQIWAELIHDKPMVFLAGPRQAGKTTFAQMVSEDFTNHLYFNWDLVTDRKMLLEKPAFFEELNRRDTSRPLVVFDEIHKYRKWKNYLKGTYDRFAKDYRFLVLGSGRLNVFQKGGDSLAGRYFLFTMWPLTLAELVNKRFSFKDFSRNPLQMAEETPGHQKIWEQLAHLTGFPEPYLSGKETVYRRWTNNYRQQLIREDIRNMTEIKDIDHVEILYSILPSKVGSPLSMDSLARDLQVSFNSIRNWLDVFDGFFLSFRLSPWEKKISRAITKERKLYLFDYGSIVEPAQKFENMVAVELWRAVSNWNDLGLGNFKLHYVRNKEKEEVDFLISKENVPWLLIEAKWSDPQAPKSLYKFQNMLNIPAVHLVNEPGVYKILSNDKNKIVIATATRWLAGLP